MPAVGEGISGVDFIGRDLEDGFVARDGVADFFNHLVSVPSVMDSPICGMRTSVAGPEVSGAGGGIAASLAAVATAAGGDGLLFGRRDFDGGSGWGGLGAGGR